MRDIDRSEYGLVRSPCANGSGYAWVCLADEPPSFEDEVIGAVAERLGDADAIEHYRIEELTVGRRIVYDVKANWKLIVENFMECYHCATIHPELTEVLPEFADGLGGAVLRRPRRRVRPGGRGIHRRRQRRASTASRASTAEQDRRYYAITVRPQVFINLVPDHVIFHRMYPMAADRTIVECDWLYLPDVVESGRTSSASVELFHRVNQQDFDACERCQPGNVVPRLRATAVCWCPPNTTSRTFHEWVIRKLDTRSGPDPERNTR